MAIRLLKLRRFSHRVRNALQLRKDPYRNNLVQRRRTFYHAMWQASATRIGANFEIIERDFCRIWNENRVTFFAECQTVLDGGVSQKLASQKVIAHRVLHDIEGYRAPTHLQFTLNEIESVSSFMSQVNGPIVIKPSSGTGAGVGVATGIDTQIKIEKAALYASLFSRSMLAEQQISGKNYRLLFLDGRLLHTVRRDPPTVTGDGQSTIAELVYLENQCRINSERPIALSPLDVDEEMKVTLLSQKLTPSSILPANQTVIVKLVSNQNRAGQNVEDGPICEDIKTLGCAIANRLRLRFMGLDLITSDLGLSLPKAKGVITDVNGSPGLHHHFLCDPLGADPKANIGKIVVDPIVRASLACNPISFSKDLA